MNSYCSSSDICRYNFADSGGTEFVSACFIIVSRADVEGAGDGAGTTIVLRGTGVASATTKRPFSGSPEHPPRCTTTTSKKAICVVVRENILFSTAKRVVANLPGRTFAGSLRRYPPQRTARCCPLARRREHWPELPS